MKEFVIIVGVFCGYLRVFVQVKGLDVCGTSSTLPALLLCEIFSYICFKIKEVVN